MATGSSFNESATIITDMKQASRQGSADQKMTEYGHGYDYDIARSNWDKAYRSGKYEQEDPVAFVSDIVNTLRSKKLHKGLGFYPGCGNGRNLLPLLATGLNIEAIDISAEAIQQLHAKCSGLKAWQGDFLAYSASNQYDFLISLQLFQHIGSQSPMQLFDHAFNLLRPGGIFALRVNSIHTQVVEEFQDKRTNPEGGFDICYSTGAKKGQRIHFYSAEEICALTRGKYRVILPLREEFIPRANGTNWAQWETILEKQ